MVIATVMLLALAIGGTVAWLTSSTGPITNTFTPSHVSCQVYEAFDRINGIKDDVSVQNTSDIPAFIRVKLVTYRTNDKGDHIGGTAELTGFQPKNGWVKVGDYYYYPQPVEAGQSTPNLIDSITLQSSYNDADGGHQAIDVMAEAIQSVPATAVQEAWHVTIANGNVAPYAG